jgi:hypothetical protein
MDRPRIIKESHQAYHAMRALSNSGISILLNQTPAHFKAWLDNELPEKTTPALLLGQLFHSLTLEPESFISRYTVQQEKGNTKAGKEEKAQADAYGLTLVSQADYDQAAAMARNTRANRRIKNLLEAKNSRTETSICWDETVNGIVIPCKARIDFLAEFDGFGLVACDLKSTLDASPGEISKSIFKYGYYRQAAWYMRALAAAGLDCRLFVFIFVEKSAPYLVSPVKLPEQAYIKGYDECQQALELYASCVKADYWPGYDDKFQEIDLPEWAYKERNLIHV